APTATTTSTRTAPTARRPRPLRRSRFGPAGCPSTRQMEARNMQRRTAAFGTTTVIIGCLLAGAPASATQGVSRTWVSQSGSDSTPCSIAGPCKTSRGASSRTLAGGEIGVLTPGEYGTILINRAVSITNDGSGEAAISVAHIPNTLAIGVSIFAGVGDVIGVRGLLIEGQAGGDVGVNFGAWSALHLQNCVVPKFTGLAGRGIGTGNNG